MNSRRLLNSQLPFYSRFLPWQAHITPSSFEQPHPATHVHVQLHAQALSLLHRTQPGLWRHALCLLRPGGGRLLVSAVRQCACWIEVPRSLSVFPALVAPHQQLLPTVASNLGPLLTPADCSPLTVRPFWYSSHTLQVLGRLSVAARHR